MKRLGWFLSLVLVSIFVCATSVMAAPTVQLNGKQLSFEVPPVVDNGRTLVPVRAIFEAMGATVAWDDSIKTVTAVKGNTTIILQLGSKTPTVNGEIKTLEVPAKAINGRTMVPLRFVGESFGAQVQWNPTTQLITINSSPVTPQIGTRANPVPFGKPYLTKQGLEITAVELRDGGSAWSVIQEANRYNDEPGPNMKYVIVTFKVKNVSSPQEYVYVSDADFDLVGSSNVLFHTFDKGAVLEDEGRLSEFSETLYHGGSHTASAHFYVPQNETNMLLVWDPFLTDKIYFALK